MSAPTASTEARIVIIDYGASNLRSVANAFHKIQAEAVVTADPDRIARAERIVLPGVGAFDEGMKNLHASGLLPTLEARVLGARVPLLGICLGLQLLTRRSDEGRETGLGWLRADTVAFAGHGDPHGLKVPHMGWNTVASTGDCQLLTDLPADPAFYFAHSYYLRCDDERDVMARTRYGVEFPAVVRSGNIVGTQFHPEKSLASGLRLLQNFAGLH